jgi:hypothetical protein
MQKTRYGGCPLQVHHSPSLSMSSTVWKLANLLVQEFWRIYSPMPLSFSEVGGETGSSSALPFHLVPIMRLSRAPILSHLISINSDVIFKKICVCVHACVPIITNERLFCDLGNSKTLRSSARREIPPSWGYEVFSHCGFVHIFLIVILNIFSCDYCLFACHFWRNVYSNPLLILKIRLFCYHCWVVGVFCRTWSFLLLLLGSLFWISAPYETICKYFLPVCFFFIMIVFDTQKLFFSFVHSYVHTMFGPFLPPAPSSPSQFLFFESRFQSWP